ncbi:MAG TPA: hypothetical protein VN783_13850 [Thermoanaerobaculia bacterium]|nr:hypothetical protein [Thermoanaerobaculia bacterium]
MGTFHQGRDPLHGITVVVETDGPELYVGRCDDVDERGVILHDADVHRGGEGEAPRAKYLENATRFGVWKKFDRIVVPRARVTAIRRLGEL